MTDVGIKVYFLFERRKSSAHKWILVHGYNGLVPKTIEEICKVAFTPSKWNQSQADVQGMHLLASLISVEKTNYDELPFVAYLDQFRAKTPTLCRVRINEGRVSNISEKAAALLVEFTSKKATVSKSSLTLHELFQFVDDLEQQPEEKRNHTIFRLIFQHMQLKLCSLKYPEVRVHFVTTFELQSTPEKIVESVTAADEIVNVEDIEDDEEEKEEQERKAEEKRKCDEEINRRMEKAMRDEEDRLRKKREDEQRILKEKKEEEERLAQEEKKRLAEEEKRLLHEEKERLAKEEERLQREEQERKEAEKRHLQQVAQEEVRCKRLAEERKEQLKIEQEKRRQQMFEQECREKKRIQEMEEARKRQEQQRFEEQKRQEREIRQLEEQRLAEKQRREQEAERERQRVEAEQREKERLEREAQLTGGANARRELSIADVYDFSGDGWDIENLEFATSDKIPATQVYCPQPTFDEMYLVQKQEEVVDSIPKNFSLLPKNVILAISEVKEETRNVTRWMQRKLCAIYPENKYSLCFISQNFSELDCATVQQFVAQKQAKNEWAVIGVECEFSPVDALSRECTTLLNEFDARTSLLILELISMPNTTVIFETTKPFNHVWCWKYNLINTPSSQWFAKASSNNDMILQRQAHSTAMIRLVTSASNQASAIVRCTNQATTQKETYFDMVVLGCHANCNETQSLFYFINEQCVQQKLQNQRWKKRISQLEIGDGLAIPISRRFNDNQYDLCCVAETERQISLAGATGALLNPRPIFRSNLSTPFMQTIPTPSSYAFTNNGINVDYQFGDPCILKNINTK